MFHRVTIIGNLGRDPEMRYTPSGQQVTSFSVATTEKWSGQDGQAQERTIWWRVSAWGKLAEVCNEYLKKGRQVFVEGSMVVDPKTGEPRIWTKQDGTPHASLELRALTVKFLGGRGDSGGAHGEAGAGGGELVADEGDIPF